MKACVQPGDSGKQFFCAGNRVQTPAADAFGQANDGFERECGVGHGRPRKWDWHRSTSRAATTRQPRQILPVCSGVSNEFLCKSTNADVQPHARKPAIQGTIQLRVTRDDKSSKAQRVNWEEKNLRS